MSKTIEELEAQVKVLTAEKSAVKAELHYFYHVTKVIQNNVSLASPAYDLANAVNNAYYERHLKVKKERK